MNKIKKRKKNTQKLQKLEMREYKRRMATNKREIYLLILFARLIVNACVTLETFYTKKERN